MKPLVTIGLLSATMGLATNALGERTYFIDQLVHYPAPCNYGDLFDDTYSMKSRMDAAGWNGVKWVDEDAWVRDWREHCSSVYGSNGVDNSNADNRSLAVFSGHGGDYGMLYFGTQNDTCSIDIDNQARLGSMDGAVAAVAMYISCETLHEGGYNEWVHQQLGFYEPTGNNTSAYASFFDDTSWKSNSQAWLDRLPGKSVLILSYTNGWDSNCWTVSDGAKLKANTYTSPRGSGPTCGAGQPPFMWCARWN